MFRFLMLALFLAVSSAFHAPGVFSMRRAITMQEGEVTEMIAEAEAPAPAEPEQVTEFAAGMVQPTGGMVAPIIPNEESFKFGTGPVGGSQGYLGGGGHERSMSGVGMEAESFKFGNGPTPGSQGNLGGGGHERSMSGNGNVHDDFKFSTGPTPGSQGTLGGNGFN